MKDSLEGNTLSKQEWMVVSRSLTHPLGLGWQGNPLISPIGARYFPRRPSSAQLTEERFALLSQCSSSRG